MRKDESTRKLQLMEPRPAEEERDNSDFLVRHVILYASFFLLNIPVTMAIAIFYLYLEIYELYVFIPMFLMNGLIFIIPYHLVEMYRRITRKDNVILFTMSSVGYLTALYFFLY